MIYLDSNAIIYSLLNKNDSWATDVVSQEGVYTATLTWDEVVHVVKKNLGRKLAKIISEEILDTHIVFLPVNKETLLIAHKYFPTLGPRDSIHLACMKQNGITTIATKDNDFMNIKGIKII